MAKATAGLKKLGFFFENKNLSVFLFKLPKMNFLDNYKGLMVDKRMAHE